MTQYMLLSVHFVIFGGLSLSHYTKYEVGGGGGMGVDQVEDVLPLRWFWTD